MARSFFSVILGFLAGFVIVSLIQMISASLNPPPADMIPGDKEAMEIYFRNLDTNARLIMLVAHLLGAFVAAILASRIAKSSKFYSGLIAGFIILIASISYNMASLSPPLFLVLDPVFSALVIYLGARLGSRI